MEYGKCAPFAILFIHWQAHYWLYDKPCYTHRYGIVFGRILTTSIDGNEDIVQGFDSALPSIRSTLQCKHNRFNVYIDKYQWKCSQMLIHAATVAQFSLRISCLFPWPNRTEPHSINLLIECEWIHCYRCWKEKYEIIENCSCVYNEILDRFSILTIANSFQSRTKLAPNFLSKIFLSSASDFIVQFP